MKKKIKSTAWFVVHFLHVTFMLFMLPAIAWHYKSPILTTVFFIWLISMFIMLLIDDKESNDFGYFS